MTKPPKKPEREMTSEMGITINYLCDNPDKYEEYFERQNCHFPNLNSNSNTSQVRKWFIKTYLYK